MTKPRTFPKRHPALTLGLINLVLLLVIAAIAELSLRFFITDYRIDYYTGTGKEGIFEYPYGKIIINSQGYADPEFDLLDTKPRIGYFGDSVNRGLGAGYPFRFSDLIEVALPQYAHWNLGKGVGSSLEENRIVETSRNFGLQYAVYLLNLNDIYPISATNDVADNTVRRLKRFVHIFDGLRSRSYLYNYLRLKAKNAMQFAGFEASGYRAYELWPNKNRAVFEEFGARVNATYEELAAENIGLCVVILPYEMQVSRDAERTYREMGFTWEMGFIEGSPQALLKELLVFPDVYDPMPAFDRDTVRIGEDFVYDKGDKIDWNHPNRKGHATISEGFLQSGSCRLLSP